MNRRQYEQKTQTRTHTHTWRKEQESKQVDTCFQLYRKCNEKISHFLSRNIFMVHFIYCFILQIISFNLVP